MSQNNLDEPTSLSSYSRNSSRRDYFLSEDDKFKSEDMENIKLSESTSGNLLETNMESQSEWSEDECRDDGAGCESTGYITDDPALENLSLLNEAGLVSFQISIGI